MKKEILINLKRFEVHRDKGGVCDVANPGEWIIQTVAGILAKGFGQSDDYNLTIFVPDVLLPFALEKAWAVPAKSKPYFAIGSQSCHYADVAKGRNFGAFTSHNIASTQAAIGAKASIIGHCEDRNGLRFAMEQFAGEKGMKDAGFDARANETVSAIIGKKMVCARAAGMCAVLCIGETAVQQGEGPLEAQKPRIEAVLRTQLQKGLSEVAGTLDPESVIIAYEPVWAIGPGKTPPDEAYVAYVSAFIKEATKEILGFPAKVVYGGGLKSDNAAMLAGINTLDGGLIALTNFTPPIGFDVDELERILKLYTA
ncbi:triosephosphate isomerase [Cohaesibacter sp. ES.047]|uniref:triose-phosphate isomerase n=1 Tax=Cohaesibacter sp. ES.047 TaxID=1798205 RepID=UPI000BB7B2A6|nr:triose-phosphate isomerase family protein [Cohaesibacter sp. ES.047]SNY91086.1 triosephosphate isomerase [Cohaesibacter sp. ES.047]